MYQTDEPNLYDNHQKEVQKVILMFLVYNLIFNFFQSLLRTKLLNAKKAVCLEIFLEHWTKFVALYECPSVLSLQLCHVNNVFCIAL